MNCPKKALVGFLLPYFFTVEFSLSNSFGSLKYFGNRHNSSPSNKSSPHTKFNLWGMHSGAPRLRDERGEEGKLSSTSVPYSYIPCNHTTTTGRQSI
ncbi:hypothetical protein HOY82DRAFT_414999 [Tuber indicum]|nr:hypothetical protein HOY82DRAFT_414999 [Tuber indicum]